MLESTRKVISDAATAAYEIRQTAAMCSNGEDVSARVHNLLVDASECEDVDEASEYVSEANDLVQTAYAKQYASNPEHYDIKTLDPLGAVTSRLAQSLGYSMAYGEV